MKFTLCWVLDDDDDDDDDAGEEEARGSGRVPIDGKLRRPCVQRNESTRWHFHKAPLTTGLPVISGMEKNCPFFIFCIICNLTTIVKLYEIYVEALKNYATERLGHS